MVNSKICSKCGEDKDLNLFSDGNGKNNKKNYCKDCDNKIAKEAYNKNKNKRKEQIVSWNQKNPDKLKQYQDNFNHKNNKLDF